MRVLYASPGLESISTTEILKKLESRCRESRRSNTVLYEALDDERVFRIVPLDTELFGNVAIFVDVFGQRGSTSEAAKTYGLTKRESEVLALLVRENSKADLARQLCVTESTIGDHVGSIMRKMNASKRIEIVAKVFQLEQDPGFEHLLG